ncbi:MAG TPA: EthD domain-containing protein [Bryobacteraceae bacterium]|nr:EthD domain-containing protein [Bryobacteraceae bacterium]
MSSNNGVTSAARRRTLIGLAGLAASASAVKIALGADPWPFVIKRASLLQRKQGISHEEFVKHWAEIHAPMARACPGIGRYTLTIVKSTATRKDVAPYEIQVDGIAEMWFRSQADFDAYSNSPATKRLRDDGATFIGREIDFVTEEKIIIS